MVVAATGAPPPEALALDGGGASSGRKGPSGQPLRGPTQRPAIIDAPPVESENALALPTIERENVRRVYDTIAEHWNHTRYKAWPRVDAFIAGLPGGSLVADLGCGNGKNIPAVVAARGFCVPSDASEPLVKIACDTFGASGLVADCLHTPLRGGIFDAALSIAVLHHLSTEPRRVLALREAARLLRPGGQLLVYCWSYEQDDERSRSRHRFEAQDVLVPWKHRTPGVKKPRPRRQTPPRGGGAPAEDPTETAASPDASASAPSADGSTPAVAASANGASSSDALGGAAAAALSVGDAESPSPMAGAAAQDEAVWQPELEVQQRYCHVYREGELLDLLAQVPELEVVESYFDTGNWCAIARKAAP